MIEETIRCDRCGQHIESTTRTPYTIRRNYTLYNCLIHYSHTIDLCEECYEELLNYLNEFGKMED